MPPEQPNTNPQQSSKLYIDLSGRGGLAPRWYGDEGDTTAQHPEYRYINTTLQNATGVYALQTYFGPNVAEDGQMVSGVYNPFRRYGYMCPPNNSFTTVTKTGSPSFTNEIRSVVYDPSGYAYFAENGGLIWRTKQVTSPIGPTDWQLPSNAGSPIFTFPIQITGTTITITDLHVYQVAGAKFVFFTYIDNGNARGDIGYFSTPSEGTNNVSYGKGVAAWVNIQTGAPIVGGAYLGSNDHFMFTAADNFTYIGDGNSLHRLDGTVLTGGANGTIYPNLLVFPTNYTLRDGLDWGGKTFLAYSTAPTATPASSPITYGGNECGVATWTRQITDQANIVPIKGIIDIRKIYVSQKGTVRIICLSAKNTTQIREWDGNKWNVLVEASADAYPTYRDSVSTAATLVYWLGRDLKIYAHGAIQEGDFEALYCPGDGSGAFGTINGSTYHAGAIQYLDDNNPTTITTPVTRTGLMISATNSAGTPSHLYWYPNLTGTSPQAQSIGAGNVFTLLEYFQTLVKINYIRMYHNSASAFGPNGSSPGETVATRGTVKVFLNQATTAQNTTILNGNDLYNGYKFIPIGQTAKSGVTAIQFELIFKAGNTAGDSTDWMPRLVEIDYEPLSKKM